jgi:hypothetical protein
MFMQTETLNFPKFIDTARKVPRFNMRSKFHQSERVFLGGTVWSVFCHFRSFCGRFRSNRGTMKHYTIWDYCK